MIRRFWVLTHRYVGLSMTVFLIIVGLTGSVLAFKEEIDLWLNPDLLRVSVRDAPLLDPLVLREKAEAIAGMHFGVDEAPLFVAPEKSYEVRLNPRIPATPSEQELIPFAFTGAWSPELMKFIYLDPYTGKKIGERRFGEVSLARKDLVNLMFRLHITLALPQGYIGLGGRILGITALLWTLDCFVGFYLTLPKWRKRPLPRREGTGAGESNDCMILITALSKPLLKGEVARGFWQRWQPAWKIKFRARATRINFDIHRAFGLWTWIMLFILAWSSVFFNLNEVYSPVMDTLLGAPTEAEQQATTPPEPPVRPLLTGDPRVDWYQAREIGRKLIANQAIKEHFVIKQEAALSLERETAQYSLCASVLVKNDENYICVNFDANTGVASPESPFPASSVNQKTRISDAITGWICSIHMAQIYGLPMKIIICLMGLVITALSVTGVVIWLKKHRVAQTKLNKKNLAENIYGRNN